LGDTSREYLCLNCGDRINQHNIEEENERIRKGEEQLESEASQTANRLFKELREIHNEFDEKVKNDDLDVKDVKKYLELKKEVNEFTKIKGTEK
jgi:hypothetical protein